LKQVLGERPAILRRNLLAIIVVLTYVLVFLAAWLELDRTYYQGAKKEILRDRYEDKIKQRLLTEFLNDTVFAGLPQGTRKEESLKTIEEIFRKIVDEEWSIFRMRLSDARENTLADVANESKLEEYNSLKNCLFQRGYQDSFERSISGGAGYIHIYWTTPLDYRPIEVLTQRYRIRLFLLEVFITVVFAGFFLVVVLPLRRVSWAIDQSTRGNLALLPRAATYLERGYNDLAREALLTRLQATVRERITTEEILDVSDLLRQSAGQVQRLFGFPLVSIRETKPGGEKTERVSSAHWYAVSEDAVMPGAALLKKYELFYEAQDNAEIQGSELWFVRRLIRRSDETDSAEFITIGYDPQAQRSTPGWPAATASRLAEEIGKACDFLRLHQADVFRQKSEANINLAENLGHDLTNIIATAKLDLMTLKQIQGHQPRQVVETPRLLNLMSESTQHLLANTRFLQEIVNIYRAFINLKRPVYEQISIDDLVRDISDLFQSSISGEICVETEFGGDIPDWTVEPRLLKLALFNILSNAADAIKDAQAAGSREGRIWVRTRFDPERQEAMIAVRDSGHGIRNQDGEMASPEEIQHIFRLGFSTKTGGASEGLGLSWVSSIVREFHRGILRARNPEEGGAELLIFLPSNPREGEDSSGGE